MPECSSNKSKCLNDYFGNQQSEIVMFRVSANTALTAANVRFLLSGFQSEDEAGCSSVDEESFKTLKQQEEVFRNLDAQYEMARSQTHTQRGMGLGFTSSMRGMDTV